MELRIKPKKLVLILLLITLVLFILNLFSCVPVFLGNKYPFGSFNFDYENNIPTLYSTFLIMCTAFLASLIACSKRENRMLFWQWLIISAAFIFIGVDESISIHEGFTEPLRNVLNTGSFFYYAWVIPYAAIVIIVILIYLPFFFKLPLDTKVCIIISAMLYVAGAIGMELIGGAWYELHGKDSIFFILASIEETLEMLGMIGFIYTFSSYIDRYIKNFNLRITSQ
jgi:hypothetical protein